MSQVYKSSSGGGAGAVNSVNGTGNIVASPTTGNVVLTNTGMQLIRGPQVDFKTTGLTTLMTTTGKFIINGFYFVGINVTGTITLSEQFNIGWTPPNYTDIFYTVASNVMATDTFSFLDYTGTIVPASTNIVINVFQAVTSSGNDLQRIDILGYYVN